MSNTTLPSRTRRTIEMGGKHMEVSELPTPLTFVRKPATLKAVLDPAPRCILRCALSCVRARCRRQRVRS